MKTIFTIASIARRYGGPSYSVPALCEALSAIDTPVELITLRKPGEAVELSKKYTTTSIDCPWGPYVPFGWPTRFRRSFKTALGQNAIAVCHDNGVWLPTNLLIANLSKQHCVPLIVSPRGMLSAWALGAGRKRKQIAWWLYQRQSLRIAKVLHATSDAEAQEFRALGLSQAIAIIPNGIEIPASQTILRKGSKHGVVRTMLFLSRIHPKKGLETLFEAWAILKPANWRLLIAGNADSKYLAALQNKVAELKIADSVEFCGPVHGDAKWRLYNSADLFMLPSHSENFGLVIAEALACGVPVITTRGTPWQILELHRCGWWVEMGTEPLRYAMKHAMSLSDDDRSEMGNRGRQLAHDHFSWGSAATSLRSVYEWMITNGSQPSCVDV